MRPIAGWADDLQVVIKHIEAMGITFNRGRIRAYMDVFQQAERNDPALSRGLLYAAVSEVYDLVACTKMSAAELKPVRHRLKKICAGDNVLTAANEHDPGRDLCFEIVTAAMYRGNGLTSELGKPSDVLVRLGGQQVLIECKRPTTLNAIGRNLKKGFGQMSVHRRAGRGGIGVVALDLSVLVNPTAAPIGAFGSDAAVDNLYERIKFTITDAQPQIKRATCYLRSDARVHAILMRAKCLSQDENGSMRVVQVWQVHPVYPIGSPEINTFYALCSRLPAFMPGL